MDFILLLSLYLDLFKGSKTPAEEISQAEQKLEESLELADSSMYNLLSGDVSDCELFSVYFSQEHVFCVRKLCIY